jgi:hypothetical protein
MPVLGKIDDCEAPKPQRDAGQVIDPNAAIVGTAMRNGVSHSRRDSPHLVGSAISRPEKTSQAAHIS